MSEQSSDGTDHWTEQDECQDCGRDDVPLRAIEMINRPKQMLCRNCFETALEIGEVDPSDPRVENWGETA
jgi:ribosomal protein S14